jgi:RNA polymerase sigma-70 factor (ECF subfamily)
MVSNMPDDPRETLQLLRLAADGDTAGLGALLMAHKSRLRRMVGLRLDPRLRGRIDPSDVIQEAFAEAAGRLGEYLDRPDVPFFLWLRFLTGQKLVTLHRHHLGTQMRDARREVSLYRGAMPGASSAALAEQLLGGEVRPSEAAVRAETRVRLQEALNALDPADREVLALRHFERLSREEAAREMGISEAATSKRYIRALGRLKGVLGNLPEGPQGIWP